MSHSRGFTLVEMLIAIVLFGIVGTAIYQMLVTNQRVYQGQKGQIEAGQHARAAAFMLPADFRELDPGDPVASDIISMSATQIQYKAMRNLYILCQPPLVGTLQLILDARDFYGLRPLDPARDSVVIFDEGNTTIAADNGWLHADVVAAVQGNLCPNGPSLTITLTNLTGGSGFFLDSVQVGAPVRSFEVVESQLYVQDGDSWLGGRWWNKAATTWTDWEPVVGPLSATGLALTYFDNTGAVTADPTAVARIAVAVVGRSDVQVRGAYLEEDLVTTAAVRN